MGDNPGLGKQEVAHLEYLLVVRDNHRRPSLRRCFEDRPPQSGCPKQPRTVMWWPRRGRSSTVHPCRSSQDRCSSRKSCMRSGRRIRPAGLVSSSDPAADAMSLHRTAIAAAVNAGVGRILYTSHQGASSDSPFLGARCHRRPPRRVRCRLDVLRNGFYAHILTVPSAGSGRPGGPHPRALQRVVEPFGHGRCPN